MPLSTATSLTFQALKLQPQNAKALFRRGQSYFHMKDFDKAERDLKAAEQLEPRGLLSCCLTACMPGTERKIHVVDSRDHKASGRRRRGAFMFGSLLDPR